MLDLKAKVEELAKVSADLKAQVSAKRYEPISNGLNELKNVLVLIDTEYVPTFEKLNKGFILRVGNGRTINYNVGYPSFVWCNGKHLNVETIETMLTESKENAQIWQVNFANYYKGIDTSLVETNLIKVLLDKINEVELENKALEEELKCEETIEDIVELEEEEE